MHPLKMAELCPEIVSLKDALAVMDPDAIEQANEMLLALPPFVARLTHSSTDRELLYLA